MGILAYDNLGFIIGTSMLDLIEKLFSRHGIRSLRFDGKMDRAARDSTLATFKQSGGPKVILISTKCGSVGLNLVSANRIIKYVDCVSMRNAFTKELDLLVWICRGITLPSLRHTTGAIALVRRRKSTSSGSSSKIPLRTGRFMYLYDSFPAADMTRRLLQLQDVKTGMIFMAPSCAA